MPAQAPVGRDEYFRARRRIAGLHPVDRAVGCRGIARGQKIDEFGDLIGNEHLAWRRGQHDVAYRQLRKQVLKRGAMDSAEGWLLLAIAARATQHPEELAQALEQAKARNADVSALTAAAAPAAPQPADR